MVIATTGRGSAFGTAGIMHRMPGDGYGLELKPGWSKTLRRIKTRNFNGTFISA
jgi:hypothetical protein